MKNNKLSFRNQKVYVGIDVHEKQWKITIIFQGLLMKTLSIDPKPKSLHKYLHNNYPGGDYYSVYEAGFSGFWADRDLRKLGIRNIIVNPADVPTKSRERRRRDDKIDSKKLARELSVDHLEGIYIPSQREESLRTLVRLRVQLVGDMVRQKQRIKSLLYFCGLEIPPRDEIYHWSRKFITYLEELEIEEPEEKQTLLELLGQMLQTRERIADIVKQLRKIISNDQEAKPIIEYLISIPGIGFIVAITLYTELMNIERFKKLDELSAYVGFAPSVDSSGEKERTRGLSRQRKKYLRNLLIESSWIAVRKDPALAAAFGKLCKRMKKQEAIIRISKKLLNRIRYVWKNQTKYELAVVV